MIKNFLLILIGIIPFLIGCGDRFDSSVMTGTAGLGNAGGDTLYVQMKSDLPGQIFNNPQAMILGHEPFIYVCDTDNDRIVMLNIDGAYVGSIGIKRPIAIAQDQRLNLIVCAQFDTSINNKVVSFSAVYKINLVAANHVIENAPIKRILPRTTEEFSKPWRKYKAVVAFFDNSYYVARVGPNNTDISQEPDNSLMQFVPFDHDSDMAYPRVHDIDPLSAGLISADSINCMTPFSSKNLDFIATFSSESSFKAQWFHHYSSVAAEGYMSQFGSHDGVAFVKPGKFVHPTGNCLGDNGEIFVADASPVKDSIYKFSKYGDELQSFGGPSVFSRPVAVTFYDKTLYVLDAGKNQIIRFKLSTDQSQ